jgi:ATP-dependent DNA helicase RecG
MAITSTDKLGRLKSLGINEIYQVALYLPDDYLDLRFPLRNAVDVAQATEQEANCCITGMIESLPVISFIPGKTSQAKYTLRLEDGYKVHFSLFGAKEELDKQALDLLNKPVLVCGKPLVLGQKVFINGAKFYPVDFAGRIMPVYKGKTKVIKPESVLPLVKKHLDQAIPAAAAFIKDSLPLTEIQKVVEPEKLELVLSEAHRPTNPKFTQKALFILDSLAAMIAKDKVAEHFRFRDESRVARIDATRWHENAMNVPFTLTSEQVTTINEIALELNKGSPCRAMLQGDVGTGKTIVYGMVAITAALQGYKVGILLPNTGLAKQIFAEIEEWMPSNSPVSPVLITGESDHVEMNAAGGKLIVGTSAILFRDVGEFDLVVVDEQQKFSRDQREQLTAGRAHLLEVSATPIPRSVALVKYGAVKVWRLKQNHSHKTIRSHLLIGKEQGKQMLHEVFRTIREGNQAIIVYALKEESEAEAMKEMKSAKEAAAWWEKHLPGRVRLVHSNMKDEQKVKALDDMKRGEADLLIATTAIEVGVTIPKAMTLAVVNADRFGLVSLWQLRGRVARKGGVGDFLMVLTKENPNPRTVERLNVIRECNDGYEVAEKDLALRGAGDLSLKSNSQSGADTNSILIGRAVKLEILDTLMEANA